MFFEKLKKFLPDQGSHSLGVYRFVYFGWLALYFSFYSIQSDPRPQLYNTILQPGIFQFFDPQFFNAGAIVYIYPIWIFSLLCTCIGFLTPLFSALSCLLGYWIYGVNFNNGVISYQEIPHMLLLLLFALSSSGRYFSFDRVLFKKNENQNTILDAQFSILFLRVTFILVYFTSAITKIKRGAYAWSLSDNAVDIFSRANIWFIHFPLRQYVTDVNIFFVKHALLTQISIFAIFVMELLTPLLILKKVRTYMIPLLLLFQFVATFALYIDFLYSFIPIFIFWINFENKKARM